MTTLAFDPTALDGWAAPDACAATVTVGDVELACEVDGPHDEHEATIRWSNPEEQT